MFSLLAKIIKRTTLHPVLVSGIALVLAVLSYYPISNLKWELLLQDALNTKESAPLDFKNIEDKFGALGSLTIVLKSNDSLLNYNAAKQLYQNFSNDSSIHFMEFETDAEFYKQHSLLYIQDNDLDTISSRIEELKKKLILSKNPFYIDVEFNSDSSQKRALKNDSTPLLNLADIEKKYLKILSTSHANNDGTIRVVDIYPKNALSDLNSNRALIAKTKAFFAQNEYSSIEVHYTGKVYESIQNGKTLLSEAKFAGKITALFILLIFIIHFYRQPQLIIVSAIPAGLPILYTLALASALYGRINLFTLLLALLLPGQACQIITHILNRYFIERTRDLSPKLCIESSILGIGPSTAASACIMAALFACLIIVPVQGIKELGVLGAIGSILNWIVTISVTSSLLQLFQKNKPFSVQKIKFHREYKFTLLPYIAHRITITIVSIISLFAIIYGCMNLKFIYNFKNTELKNDTSVADSLIAQTGFPLYEPIIVMMPDSNANDLYQNFKSLKSKNAIPTIDNVYTLDAFSPKSQTQKKQKLIDLQNLFSKDFIQNLDSADLSAVSSITQILYRNDFDDEDQPENIRKKFSDVNGNPASFAFIFTNIDPDDGLACRHLSADLKKFEGINDNSYKLAGISVLRAKFLDLVLSNVDKTIMLGSVLVWLFLLVFYNRFSRALFTLLPSAFAMSWLITLIHIFEIKLSVYSTIAFPILIGASVDGSLQLWSAYYDKQKETALILLQRKFFSVGISQMAALIGSYGLLISSHPGLRSIGQISLIGLICISFSQFTIFPLIAGSLDNYRLLKKKKKK